MNISLSKLIEHRDGLESVIAHLRRSNLAVQGGGVTQEAEQHVRKTMGLIAKLAEMVDTRLEKTEVALRIE